MSNNTPAVSYYCTIEVTPKGSFPVGSMLTVANMKDLLPKVSTQEYDSNTAPDSQGAEEDAILNMDVVVDFSGYVIGGDATDELMEVCALSMRSALQSQLDLSITNGHNLHSCHVVYKGIHFRDCGLFQYPMQRIVEGLLGVVPEVLFDVLVPPTPVATAEGDNNTGVVTATDSSDPTMAPSHHQRKGCILNVSCESLDFGVNLFHTEYLTAFADELAWVVGSTSRLSRDGSSALLDLAHCTIALNYCTEITPSNVCQIVGTCLRAQATPSPSSSEEGGCHRCQYPFSIDVSGGTMVPLMPTLSNANSNGDDADGSGMVNTSDTLRRSSTFKLVVLSPKDGMDDAAGDMLGQSTSLPTTTTSSQCWRLQLLETLEFELLYLVGDGLLPSDGSNLPSVSLDGFLDFPEGYTLQHNGKNNSDVNGSDTTNTGGNVRLLEFNADDGGASLRAILSSFAAEFPAACRCIRVPITAQRAAAVAASGVVVVGTVYDEASNEDMHLSSSASPKRHDRKPLEETSPILPQSATTAPALSEDATLKWCSLEDVVRIVSAEVAHNEQQHQEEKVVEDTNGEECSLVSVSTTTDHHHTSPVQRHHLDDSQLESAAESIPEAADDRHISEFGVDQHLSLDGSAILAASTTSADDQHTDLNPLTSIPSKHLSPVDHSRLIPPSRRRLTHAAHSLAETENGLGARLDSCLHATTTSPSRSTVGPCRGGGAASRSVSPPQHNVSSSAVVAPTSPSSRSLSPSHTATDAIAPLPPTTVAVPTTEVSAHALAESSERVVGVVSDKEEDADENSHAAEEDSEEDHAICPTEYQADNHYEMHQDVHSPSQDRCPTYSQERAGSAIPMTPNHLNNTLPPGTSTNIAPVSTDPPSLSRVSSIAPTRTTSPANGTDGRSISLQHRGCGFSRSTSSLGDGTIVAGSTTKPSVMMMGGAGRSWESGTVYMMTDVEHYGIEHQHHHRHQKPPSKTVISTVHIHQQHPHYAPRLESTSRSNSAASGVVSRVASLSPVPCQPYTTTISRRCPTTNMPAVGGAVVSRTSSIALERQVDIPPNVQVHSLKSVSARVHPNTLLVTSKPLSSVTAVVAPSTPTTTPAKKPIKKLKKSTKKSTKSTSKKSATPEIEAVPTAATSSFFQGLLDRHERVKTDLALKGGVHRVRKSSMTTVSPTPCPPSFNAVVAPALTSGASSRVASISPAPVAPTTTFSHHQLQRQAHPIYHSEVAAHPQDGDDSLADAVRRHLLLYAPRPIPVPVTEQCQAGLARCISSRRSSIVTNIHACSSKGPKRSGTPRSGTPRGSQPTSRSSSAATGAVVPNTVPTPSVFIDTIAPIHVDKEVPTESPQSCWSEGGADGMHMSRSPSCQQPDANTHTTPTASTPTGEAAPAVVAVHRTSSVQVRVRRPSLRQN